MHLRFVPVCIIGKSLAFLNSFIIEVYVEVE